MKYSERPIKMKCVYASPSLFSTHIFLSLHPEQTSYSRRKTSQEGTGQTAGNKPYQVICLSPKSP